jgi:hypothetical protein
MSSHNHLTRNISISTICCNETNCQEARYTTQAQAQQEKACKGCWPGTTTTATDDTVSLMSQFCKMLHFVLFTIHQLNHSQNEDDELDKKQQYEDEAEESDIDFINDEDDEPDESDSDAQMEVKAASKALRNRQTWQEVHLDCHLCQDLRVVFRHLLGLK